MKELEVGCPQGFTLRPRKPARFPTIWMNGWPWSVPLWLKWRLGLKANHVHSVLWKECPTPCTQGSEKPLAPCPSFMSTKQSPHSSSTSVAGCAASCVETQGHIGLKHPDFLLKNFTFVVLFPRMMEMSAQKCLKRSILLALKKSFPSAE